MAILESQLDTWSKTGASAQSRDTYASVKGVLEDTNSPYYPKTFVTRLQGSYANDTNVYRDSDVDVLIRLDSTFYHDAPTLPADQQQLFEKTYPGVASYGLPQFKVQVADWLRTKYGSTVKVGSKAIFIPGNGTRRDCDVLPCARFKYYYRFTTAGESFADGICFWLKDGTRVVNFPVQHSDNCTNKHQATSQWFKPTVRIYKNMRNCLVDRNLLKDGVAPSYFIEGMLWNVPVDKFGTSWEDTFVNTFNFLSAADRSSFKCANAIHPLLGTSPVNWKADDCATFLNTLKILWNNWGSV
jgi:hypothetical protein